MESLHHNWIPVLVHFLPMFPKIFRSVYWMFRRAWTRQCRLISAKLALPRTRAMPLDLRVITFLCFCGDTQKFLAIGVILVLSVASLHVLRLAMA